MLEMQSTHARTHPEHGCCRLHRTLRCWHSTQEYFMRPGVEPFGAAGGGGGEQEGSVPMAPGLWSVGSHHARFQAVDGWRMLAGGRG